VRGKDEIDPRLYEVGVSALVDGDLRRLSTAESRMVIHTFPEVRAEAARWRLKLGRPGRILLIDERLCALVCAFLEDMDRAERPSNG
jgi:hypothetical protein